MGGTPRYRVESYDAFDAYDEDITYAREGEFETAAEAVACARGVVVKSLEHLLSQGSADLAKAYWSFGNIPFIRGDAAPAFDVAACVAVEIERLKARCPSADRAASAQR
jgi:hypothetical protein